MIRCGFRNIPAKHFHFSEAFILQNFLYFRHIYIQKRVQTTSYILCHSLEFSATINTAKKQYNVGKKTSSKCKRYADFFMRKFLYLSQNPFPPFFLTSILGCRKNSFQGSSIQANIKPRVDVGIYIQDLGIARFMFPG